MGLEGKLSRSAFLKIASVFPLLTRALTGSSPILPQTEIWEKSGPEVDSSAFRILLLTDIHSGITDTPFQANTLAVPYLHNLVNNLRSSSFEFLVLLGDLIKETPSQTINELLYREVLNILADLPFPTINLLANHDLWGIPRERLCHILNQHGLNPPKGLLQYDDFQIAWLDLEAPPGIHGWLPENTITWLEENTYQDYATFIFTHYPLLPQNSLGNPYFRDNPQSTALANGPQIWEALAEKFIPAIISGHTHSPALIFTEKTLMFTLPAAVENLDSSNLTEYPGSYSILEITDPLHFIITSYRRFKQIFIFEKSPEKHAGKYFRLCLPLDQ